MPEQLLNMARSAAALQPQRPGGRNPLAETERFQFSKDDAAKSFANRVGIKVVKVDDVKDTGMVGYRIDLTFDSLAHLEEALSSRQEGGLTVNNGSKLSLLDSGRSFRFQRLIAASKTGPASRPGSKSSADQAAQGMAAMFFANHYLTYRYHFPFKVVSSNSTHLDPKTNTAEWKFALADVMTGDLDMHAELAPGHPLSFYLILSAVVIALLSAVFLLYRSRRRTGGLAQPSQASPLARPTAPRFQTREEYEAWKQAQPRGDGTV